MTFWMEPAFGYAQTELRMQTHLEVQLLNYRFLILFGNTVLLMCMLCFHLSVTIPDGGFEIVLTAILQSRIVN